MKNYFPLIPLLIWLGSATAFAKAARFEVRDAAQRDVVQFISDTPLEKVVGVSTGIVGWTELDPEAIGSGVKGEFEVDLRTFDTGNSLRNEILRDKFFQTAEFPSAVFTVSRLIRSDKSRLIDGQPTVMRVEGKLRVKGVTKSQAVLLKVTYFKSSETTRQRLGGNLLRVSCNFDLDLGSFGIPLPDAVRARVSQFVQVAVDVVGSDNPNANVVPIPEGIKPK